MSVPAGYQLDFSRCDCESIFCRAHEAGACKSHAGSLIQIFGHKQKLCKACLVVAQKYFADKLEILRSW
jgi:hypothetical protein